MSLGKKHYRGQRQQFAVLNAICLAAYAVAVSFFGEAQKCHPRGAAA